VETPVPIVVVTLVEGEVRQCQESEKVEVKVKQKVLIWKKPQKEASYITGGCFLCPPSRCIIKFESKAKQSKAEKTF
jgi:hypothetical protein